MKEMKYQLICRLIRTQIMEGFWNPGEKIYSERQLANLHFVSRLTIKRAITELISEGLLEYRQGRKGTFVSERYIADNVTETEKDAQFIGVAIDNQTPAFASHLLQGIHDTLWESGFHTLYCNTYHDNEHVLERIQSLIDASVAGVIYTPVLGEGYLEINRAILNKLDKNRIPIVLVDRHIEERLDHYVVLNDRETFKELAIILLDSGHKRILFIKGFDATSSHDRVRGFHDAFQQCSADQSGALEIHLDEKLLFDEGEIPDNIIDEVRNMGDITAIIGLNQQLLEAGKRIAKQLNLDILTATISSSPREKISDITVVQPINEMGREAASLLVKQIKNKSTPITQLILKSTIQDNR